MNGQETTYSVVDIFMTVQKSLAILIYTSCEVLAVDRRKQGI
jgi:hypothetical protein